MPPSPGLPGAKLAPPPRALHCSSREPGIGSGTQPRDFGSSDNSPWTGFSSALNHGNWGRGDESQLGPMSPFINSPCSSSGQSSHSLDEHAVRSHTL